jgi:hypothetical protein
MVYQLRDTWTSSLLESSEDVDKILSLVHSLIDSNGPEVADRLSFLAVSDDETVIYEQVSGAALRDRARVRVPTGR